MKDIIREYNTLKLFRGKRKNDELNRLSSSNLDFEYRRLYIEERELDLHVFCSRETVFNWAFISFMGLAIYLFQYPLLALTMFGFGLVAKMTSFRYRFLVNRVIIIYSLVLKIVNSAIYNEYGISLF